MGKSLKYVKDFDFSSAGKTVGYCGGGMAKKNYAEGGKMRPAVSAMAKKEIMATPTMQKREVIERESVKAPAAPKGMLRDTSALGIKGNKNPGIPRRGMPVAPKQPMIAPYKEGGKVKTAPKKMAMGGPSVGPKVGLNAGQTNQYRTMTSDVKPDVSATRYVETPEDRMLRYERFLSDNPNMGKRERQKAFFRQIVPNEPPKPRHVFAETPYDEAASNDAARRIMRQEEMRIGRQRAQFYSGIPVANINPITGEVNRDPTKTVIYRNISGVRERPDQDVSIVREVRDNPNVRVDSNGLVVPALPSLRSFKKGGAISKAGQSKIPKVMGEFKSGKLHSGSKSGPVVKSSKQALAIALSEARNVGKKKK